MRADHSEVGRLLKTARGQIDGVLRMVEEDRYCVEISHQLMACEALVRKANKAVLRAHMQGCVRDALEAGQGSVADEKIKELTEILDKMQG